MSDNESQKILDFLNHLKIKLHSIKEEQTFLRFRLEVEARPGSKKEKMEILESGSLKLHFRQRPIDGAANDAIIEFFSDFFSISCSQITLASGIKSKKKVFEFYFLFTAHRSVSYYYEKMVSSFQKNT